MQVQIKDAATLRRISPAMLCAYLETNGWVRKEVWRDNFVVLALEHNKEVPEILAPLHESSYRYPVRISEVVQTLSEIENRSQLDVYYDLIRAGADTIRLQSSSDAEISGLSINGCANFLGDARDLLKAAARYAYQPGMLVYRGGISRKVSEYLEEVQLLAGYGTGYDLTLHSPVPANNKAAENSRGVPFARLANETLNSGLREAHKTVEAVWEGAEISAFGETAPKGVSANFCDAIADLAKYGHSIKISLSWAPMWPSDDPSGEFVFSKDDSKVFSDGAKWLRQSEQFSDVHTLNLDTPPRGG